MSGRGLNTTLHPGLTNPRLLKRDSRNQNNPYLSDANQEQKKKKKRLGLFHQKGDISDPLQKQRDEYHLRQEKIAKGELPNALRGEDKYFLNEMDIPKVEWWDQRYYLPEGEADEDEDDDDEEEGDTKYCPSIEYVFHPVPPKSPEKEVIARLYLTSKERRQLRRNKRLLQQREVQRQIQLGLAPKPENKMKLSTMMNQQGQGIDMPTGWEQTVKNAMSERKRQHDLINQRRHEMAKLQRHKDENFEYNNDFQVNVYRFNQLINPSIRYKLTTNSRQLQMRGVCLRCGDDGPGIIILLSPKEKSLKFMDRLIMNRLPWRESFSLKNDESGKTFNMSGNKIELVWTGRVNEEEYNRFPLRWFMKVCFNESEMIKILSQFKAEHYYKKLVDC